MSIISQQQEAAYRQIAGWDDLVHMSPSAAASVMGIVRGCPVLEREAEVELGRAKRRQRHQQVAATVADFQRDSLGKAHAAQYGGAIATTDLYKMISNKRFKERQDNA